MAYRGAFEINRRVRNEERRQLLLRSSEWEWAPRPARGTTSPPLRRWLAAALHGLAIRIEPRAAGWRPQVQD
jgi:hypothetical protein